MQMLKAKFILVILAFLAACQPELTPANTSSSAAAAFGPTVIDPRGDYVLRSDPAITKAPAPDLVLGDGSLVQLGYDGSKGVGLDYQLFYVRDDGSVVAITTASFEDIGGGQYQRDIVVFNSDADGRAGFIELSTMFTPPGTPSAEVYTKSKFVSLGMYPVRYKLKK